LQQTSQGYDCESMVEAEPAIQQLKLDFAKSLGNYSRTFRQTINQTQNSCCQLLNNRYDFATIQSCFALEQTLEQEAEIKLPTTLAKYS